MPQIPSTRQALIEALAPLAAIDPNGPDFNRPLDMPTFKPDPSGRGPIPPTEVHVVATFERGGRTALLRQADTLNARECLRKKDPPASTVELRTALAPLAALPDDDSRGVLYTLPATKPATRTPEEDAVVSRGCVEITAAMIRRARELLQAGEYA